MVLFEETQKISRRWKLIFIVLLIICTILFLLVDRAFIGSVIFFGVFTVLAFIPKLNIRVYEDRYEYRLVPYHVTNRVIMFDSIVSVDMITPVQIGVSGFKIKNTSTGMVYYFGGGKILRVRTNNSKDILIGIRGINEMLKVLEL